MRSDNPFRPDHRVATTTSFQNSVVRFDYFLTGARFELGPREWDLLLDIMSRRIPGEYARVLKHEWRQT